jgi:hypothetical protein
MRVWCVLGLASLGLVDWDAVCLAVPATPAEPVQQSGSLDLPSTLKSPTLEKWRNQIPDVAQAIKTDPAFRTRLRLGYKSFGDRSTNPTGWQIGLEDLRIGRTRATFSANYSSNASGNDRSFGADLYYSLMPLGKTFQIAPLIGYRQLTVNHVTNSGLNVGWRTRLNLSRKGAADITFDQSWVAPGTDSETGLSTLSFGYAVTKNIRLSTDWQRQQSRERKDDRWGIAIEWMP